MPHPPASPPAPPPPGGGGDGEVRVGHFSPLRREAGSGDDWSACDLRPEPAPSDPLLLGEWGPPLAAELHAFAVAAEADARYCDAAEWYAKELKVRMHLAAQVTDEVAELRRRTYSVLRCCEGAGRCLTVGGEPEAALVMHERALRCAVRGQLADDDPSIAGARVAVADARMRSAAEQEALRRALASTPDDAPERVEVAGDEWLGRVKAAARRRDDEADTARRHYEHAAVSYRVHAAAAAGGSAAAAAGDAAEGEWAPHVAHCLARIGEGLALCHEPTPGFPVDPRAAAFQLEALDVYRGHAEAPAPLTRPAAAAAAPYCGGFEYDPADFDARGADAGDGARVRALAARIGGMAPDDVAARWNTWVPTCLEVEDAVDDGAVDAALDAARRAAPGLLAAYVGAVEDPGDTVVFAAGARRPVVVHDSPYAAAMLRRTLPPPAHHPHLRLWTDLSDKEVAKCHGHDWEGRPRVVRVPLLDAVRGGDRALVTLLLDFGCDPRACSPHDMRTPLMVAVDAGDVDTAVLLLHHPLVTVDGDPPEELFARRRGAMWRGDVCRAPAAAGKAAVRHHGSQLPLGTLLSLVLRQPLAKALQWYDDNHLLLLRRLLKDDAGGDAAAARCFADGAPLAARRQAALGHALAAADDVGEMVPVLLRFVAAADKQRLACDTDDVALFTALLGDGAVDVNARLGGRLLCSHHIERGNAAIIQVLVEVPELDECLLTTQERKRLDEICHRWDAPADA